MAVDQKLVILVDAKTKRSLEAEAKRKHTSVGDLVRRRISGDDGGEDERAFLDALVSLGVRAREVLTRIENNRAERARELEDDGARVERIRAEIEQAITADDLTRLRHALVPQTEAA